MLRGRWKIASFGRLGADRSRSEAEQQKSVWDVPLLQFASRLPDRDQWEKEIHLRSPWVEAFRIAPSKARVLPVEEQINHCVQEFKRVNRVEAVISRALEQKAVFEMEVNEGEAR